MALTRTTGNSGGIFPTVADLQLAGLSVNNRAELSTGERYVVSATNTGDGILLSNGNYANPIGLEGIRYDLINSPDLDLFAKNKVGVMLNGEFTNESTTEAKYTDVYGTIQTATTDGTFRQFRPESDGYRFEGTSTNEVLQSELLQTSPWLFGVNNPTLLSGNNLAPDGTTTAEFYEDADVGLSRYNRQLVTGTYNGFVTSSAYFKAGTSTVFGLRVALAGGTTRFTGTAFDSLTKTFLSTPPTGITFDYEELVDGWFRVIMIIDSTGLSNTSIDLRVYPTSQLAASQVGTAYIWGVQVEQLPFATSYTPTTAAPVTRTADENSALYYANMPRGDQAFTIRFKGVIDGYTNTNRLFGAESGINEVKAIVNNDLSISLFNGSDSSRADTAPIIAGAVFDYVITSDGTNYKSYLDGLFQNSSTVNNPAIGITNELRILRGVGAANDAYGNCSIFQAWIGEALTAEEIKFISGGA